MNSKAIRKQLFAAVAMVLVAAVALGSSTYAWFVASGTVEATGMQVQAQAEAGIVISNNSTSGFASTATTATTPNPGKLIPSSTENGKAWFHAVSDTFDNAKAGQAAEKYDVLGTGTDGTDYMKNTFYIKSATNAAYSGTLKINEVKITNVAGQDLSKALRVGVMVDVGGTNEAFYIYGPVTGFTTGYKVGGGSTAVTPLASNTVTTTGVTTLPASTASPVQVDIYLWYEGEDAMCNSSKVDASLETNSVTVTFEAVKTTT